MGPPYSQAQLPGGSCRREKKARAFWTEASGVLGVWRSGRTFNGVVNGSEDRARSWNGADQRQTEVVPIGRGLRPGFDFLVGLQVMPCLSSGFVQEPPSLDVSSLLFTSRGNRRAVQVLLRVVGIGIHDRLLHPRHPWCSKGAGSSLHDLGFPFL